jgi:hypothetical protein
MVTDEMPARGRNPAELSAGAAITWRFIRRNRRALAPLFAEHAADLLEQEL